LFIPIVIFEEISILYLHYYMHKMDKSNQLIKTNRLL